MSVKGGDRAQGLKIPKQSCLRCVHIYLYKYMGTVLKVE